MSQTLIVALQLILALGLLNVWLVRSRSATSYRGGDSRSLKEEFAAYGLPAAVFYLVGALKIGAAVLLIAGLWIEPLVLPAVAIIVVLMVGALLMHAKVRDPLMKSLPAFAMLILSSSACYLLVT